MNSSPKLQKTPSPANKPIVAVDIDDVIASHALAFIEYSNQKYGTHLTVDNYQDHWSEVWKANHQETLKRAVEYHESGFIATYGTINGAFETLNKLKDRYILKILTTRRSSINKLTRTWIEEYYPGIFSDIIFSGFFDNPTKQSIHMTKAELAKQIKTNYLIDDQLKHCLAAAEAEIKALLFGDYPWNQASKLPKGVIRVKNWQKVLEYFENEKGR
jgi:uncharacterized HAD superfamily protein